MKFFIFLVFMFLQIFMLSAQTITWSKYFDPSVDGETIDFMVKLDSSYLIGTNIFCSGSSWNGCLYLRKIDKNGETLHETYFNKDEKLDAFGISYYSKEIIKNDNYFLLPNIIQVPNDQYYYPSIGVYDSNLNLKEYKIYKSQDTIEHVQISNIYPYGSNIVMVTRSFNNKYDPQEVKPVLVIIDDTLGQIAQHKVKGLEEYRLLDNPNFVKLKDGTIACVSNVRLYGEGLTDDRHIALFRFDTTGNLFWKKIITQSGFADKNYYNTDIDELENGNIVFIGARILSDEEWQINESPFPNYVQCNNINGDSIWRKEFRTQNYSQSPGVIKVLPNGNIVGGGVVSCGDCYPGLPGPIYKSWLFCLSPSGKLLWERYYKNPNEPVDVSYFRKIVACTDGGILVGTEGRETEQTTGGLWLLKLDSMGCMTPDCSGTELYTAVKDEKGAWQNLKEVFFRIYPNPVGNILTVDFFSPQPGRKMELLLSDIQGILIQKQPLPNDKHQEQIDVSGLKPGSYTISLLMNGKVIQSELVVKE